MLSLLSFVETVVSSYFVNTPCAKWSYNSFLEAMRPSILTEKKPSSNLEATWRKRYLTALKKIINDNSQKQDERSQLVHRLATMLTTQVRLVPY